MVKLEIENVSFTYPATLRRTLQDISLSFSAGERVALIGQNGAGKTTLTKQLNGILQPSTGRVLIDGVNVARRSTAELAAQVGYVFQNPNDQLFLDSVKKEFEFGPQNIGMDRQMIETQLELVSERVGLNDRMGEHPLDLNDADKKFCAIGAVLTMAPEIVVMDEPTGGQDGRGRKRLSRILTWLKSQGKLSLVVTHDMTFVAENFDRVIVMTSGRVVLDGTPREVFSHPDELSQASVTPPPVTRLAQQLGWSKTILTAEEFVQEVIRHR